MKILVISNMYPSDKVPNYGTFVKNFCNQLDEIGLQYDKVVKTKDSNKIISYIIYYLKVFFHVLFKKYEVIYVHYASHNALPLLIINKIKKIKVYTNVHGGDVVPQTFVQRKMQKYTKKLLEISEKVIVPSTYFKNLMKEMYMLPEQKIHIYPSAGVNNKHFYPFSKSDKRLDQLEGLYIENGVDYVGFVGRLEHGKGWNTFLEAIYLLKKEQKFKNKKVIIVGNGVQYNAFNQLINKYNLEKDVIHIKSLPQDKLPALYNILSVFCFPTERKAESLGLVALEALSCGIPVIASDYAAPKYYIKDGFNGFKFEKGNARSLANKLEYFFNLPNETKKILRKNAFNSSSVFYTDNIRDQLENIFK